MYFIAPALPFTFCITLHMCWILHRCIWLYLWCIYLRCILSTCTWLHLCCILNVCVWIASPLHFVFDCICVACYIFVCHCAIGAFCIFVLDYISIAYQILYYIAYALNFTPLYLIAAVMHLCHFIWLHLCCIYIFFYFMGPVLHFTSVYLFTPAINLHLCIIDCMWCILCLFIS